MQGLKTKEDKLKAIAESIKSRLNCLHINRQSFAELMQVQPSSVTKWLSGSHNFTVDTLSKIEYMLGMNIFNGGIKENSSSRPCASCLYFKESHPQHSNT